MAKRNTKLWRARKKSILNAPKWLKTVQIAKGAYEREPGTFGPASEVVHIDPATGRPVISAADGAHRPLQLSRTSPRLVGGLG